MSALFAVLASPAVLCTALLFSGVFVGVIIDLVAKKADEQAVALGEAEWNHAEAIIIEQRAEIERVRGILRRIVADFETNYCIEGVIVDDPDASLILNWRLACAALNSTGEA